MVKIWISKEKENLDKNLIVQELLNTYWAGNRTREQIEKSLEHSICFGLYEEKSLIGFARVISDQSTFAYLCDVFVIEDKQGQGHGKTLVEYILSDPDLLKVNWLLRTKDAHGLYDKYGFSKTLRPERYMERNS